MKLHNLSQPNQGMLTSARLFGLAAILVAPFALPRVAWAQIPPQIQQLPPQQLQELQRSIQQLQQPNNLLLPAANSVPFSTNQLQRLQEQMERQQLKDEQQILQIDMSEEQWLPLLLEPMPEKQPQR